MWGGGGGGGGNPRINYLFTCSFVCPVTTPGPKGLKYTRFNEDHPGVVIRKFSEDQIIPYPWVYFPSKNLLVVVTTLA